MNEIERSLEGKNVTMSDVFEATLLLQQMNAETRRNDADLQSSLFNNRFVVSKSMQGIICGDTQLVIPLSQPINGHWLCAKGEFAKTNVGKKRIRKIGEEWMMTDQLIDENEVLEHRVHQKYYLTGRPHQCVIDMVRIKIDQIRQASDLPFLLPLHSAVQVGMGLHNNSTLEITPDLRQGGDCTVHEAESFSFEDTDNGNELESLFRDSVLAIKKEVNDTDTEFGLRAARHTGDHLTEANAVERTFFVVKHIRTNVGYLVAGDLNNLSAGYRQDKTDTYF